MTHLGSSRTLCAASTFAIAAALSSSAFGSVHQWDYNPGMSGIAALNNEGGSFQDIRSQFDTTTRTLSWTAEFSDRVTEGFALVVTNGSTPVSRGGQFAIIYFDAAAVVNGLSSVPRLTAYSYNGHPVPDSWTTGDCIKSLWDSAWILNSFAGDVTLDGGVTGRRFSLTIDATDLINHAPPGGGSGWFGTGYTEQIGLWMFTAGVFDAEYASDGRLASLGTELRGNIQGGNLPTGGIPAPGAAALVGAGLLALSRRRR